MARTTMDPLRGLLLRGPIFLHPGSLLLALRSGEGAFLSGGRWLGNGSSNGSKRILRRTASSLRGTLQDFYGSIQAVALGYKEGDYVVSCHQQQRITAPQLPYSCRVLTVPGASATAPSQWRLRVASRNPGG
jgi:hypothetical protein